MNILEWLYEYWLPIRGYEGFYEVSNWGNVRSIERLVVYKNGNKRVHKGQMLKQAIIRNYPYVILSKNGVETLHSVHRLVAQTFIPNQNNYQQVNHKTEKKTENFVWNLEWCSAKYNTNYGTGLKRSIETRTKNNRSNAEKSVIATDINGNDIFFKSMAIAEKLGFGSHSKIAAVCKRRRNKHNGYKWRYA